MKTKTETKSFAVLFMALALLFAFTACGVKMGDAFDEEEVKASATRFLDYLSAGEYDRGMDMMSTTMQAALTQEDLTSIMEDMELQAGAFKEYKSIAVTGKNAQEVEYAVAVVVASYENRNVIYTIVFNTDMEIDGFFLK